MTKLVSVPGIGSSGPGHWQSSWEGLFAGSVRISPASWTEPVLEDWIEAIEREADRTGTGAVFVCHSLGCLAFLHWAAVTACPWRGAFLVGIPDANGPNFPAVAAGFEISRIKAADRPILALVSSDDPYDPKGVGAALARNAGGTVIGLGARGHVNEASGLGDWSEGRALFSAFLTGLATR
ncbi:RBBP9/YdeN family alpha/beta hydrolase [Roseibium sp. Sym1]|uniref:RBBP9/YdeN family alpha/beta hydrolase n=1 Tax=Roseibium sp. Sym1 TaxID=3016006 RepID=UPI0022B5CC84|nr:alpha/beta hydrolase [Roseibium sp. Sym1]